MSETRPAPTPQSIPDAEDVTVSTGFAISTFRVRLGWRVAQPTGSDWIGLYEVGAPDSAYQAYAYTGSQGLGESVLTVPAGAPPGMYETRMFRDDGYQRIAGGHELEDGRFPVVGEAGLSVDASSVGVPPGLTVSVDWRDVPSPAGTDWVGLYRRGAPDKKYLAYRYTNGAAYGNLSFPIPADAVTGGYELRLFHGAYQRIASTRMLVKGATDVWMNLGFVPAVGGPGNQIKVNWTGLQNPGNESAWAGLFRVEAGDTEYATYVDISGVNGSATLTIPNGIVPGDHEIRVFGDGGFGRLAITYRDAVVIYGGNSFRGVSTNGYPRSRAGEYMASWSGDQDAGPFDWVGLYAGPGSDSADYLAWRYTSGKPTGRRALVPAAGAQASHARLFRDNGFTPVAWSSWI